MLIFKKILLVLITPLFSFLLFATAVDYGFVHTASHSGTVKKIVADSGIYSSVVPSVLTQNKSISTDLGDLSTSDPVVKDAANKAISPQFVQTNTEAAIDSIYQWLDGKTVTPNFNINLAGSKTVFADSLSSSVQQRLASLPRCTTLAQVQSFNALNATCLPSSVSPATAAAELKASLLSGDGFLNQTTINANTIKNGDSNSSVFHDQNIPKQYQRAKKTPYLLALLAVLSGTGIVLLSPTWRRGVKHVGITMLVMGILMLLFAWGLDREVVHQAVPNIKIDNAALQANVRALVTDLVAAIDKNYWFFGGLYSILGALGLGWLWYGRQVAAPGKAKAKVSKQPPAGDLN